MVSSKPPHSADPLLRLIGARVRAAREEAGISRRELAKASELSERFLAQVETGQGNIAVTRLERLARSLGTSLVALVTPPTVSEQRAPVLALLGLRGAGKSTLGRRVASHLNLAFWEHDRLVEDAAGMELGEIFLNHGEDHYRRLARRTIEEFLDDAQTPMILASSGGVVTDTLAFQCLRERTYTVWLAATPNDHWARVKAQGDNRPMQDRPEARAELRELLAERTPLYRQADEIVNTSALGEEAAETALINIARSQLPL